MNDFATLSTHTRTIVDATLKGWAEHERFLQKSFQARSEDTSETVERVAEHIVRLTDGDLTPYVRGYRWMCEMILEEELHFRRSGSYRYSSFAEVNQAVYGDDERMSAYMDGLLLSEVLWDNHARSIDFYARGLAHNCDGYAHLEIGPGHGMLLHFAASDPRCASVAGWDISPTSLAHTRECLEKLGVERPVDLQERDVMAPLEGKFDSVVVSEVCEHLEDPLTALRNLRQVLAPGGRLFVNIPINSPTIDHIYLWREPEQVIAMIQEAGFEVRESLFAPSGGYSEKRARRMETSISVAVFAVSTS